MNNYKENMKKDLKGLTKKMLDQNGLFNNTPSKSRHFVKLIKYCNWTNGKPTSKALVKSLTDTFSNKRQTV